MNRDNAATALGGFLSAQAHALHVSQRGATKALALAGAVFHHKDDKKGQQDSIQFFLEEHLGYFHHGQTPAIPATTATVTALVSGLCIKTCISFTWES